ncbi:TrkA family potassium uptake protein [Massilia sp. CCM 8733]|uniref:TrkA family potassium uptake protein n=1 Tax=Massilia mucilaginosa TaxID=2609282 RepID=A0ABX0NYT5_9BURK|nr:TrkA family potassium uptake protein [Massilia mucilaginosa]NHZ91781.1 TrkA family potassium uptake protein [Massilia mucilaginosa]
MKTNATVIGLGAFGSTIALELSRLGHDVLGIDANAERTNAIADQLARAVTADARDERVLRELSVHESDIVVVAIGEDIEANILTTLLVKSMPKPKVWAKALNHNHHRILEKLGADHIVHPEHEMGLRVARTLIYPEVLDYISLGDDTFLVEVRASERLSGKTIEALHLAENRIECMLVKHRALTLNPAPPAYRFELGDQIVLLGLLTNLRKISRYL